MRGIKSILLIVGLVMLYACSKKEYNIENQRTRIESFLNSKGIEYVDRDGVYMYKYYESGSTPVANIGDSVYFFFSGYTFNGNIGPLFTTNIESEATAVGFDKTYMDFSAKGIKLGDGTLIKGLEIGMQGIAPGDSAMVFMSSDMGYSGAPVGIVSPGSSLTFRIIVDKIVK